MELDGISYAIAGLATVYGPRQRTDLEGGVVAIFAERLRKGLPITINATGEQSRDFVHVAGVVDALLVMTGSRIEGTRNVGTRRAISILELVRALEVAIRPAVEVRHGDVRRSRLSIEAIERPRLATWLRSGQVRRRHCVGKPGRITASLPDRASRTLPSGSSSSASCVRGRLAVPSHPRSSRGDRPPRARSGQGF